MNVNFGTHVSVGVNVYYRDSDVNVCSRVNGNSVSFYVNASSGGSGGKVSFGMINNSGSSGLIINHGVNGSSEDSVNSDSGMHNVSGAIASPQ